MENKQERKSFDVRRESKAYAIESIRLYQQLTENEERKEFILSKQYLISSTRIGDLLRQENPLEAYYAAKSAKYWLELLYKGGYIDDIQAEKMLDYCDPLVRILYVISHPEARKEKETSANAPVSGSSLVSSSSPAGNNQVLDSFSTSKYQKGGAR